MSSSNTYYSQILNSIIVYVYQSLAIVLYIVANAGNLISALVFFRRSWRKNVCVFYFLVFLFFNSCYVNFTFFASILSNGYSINTYNRNSILCKVFFYASYIFTRFVPIILILASIDRLLLSSQHVDIRLYSSRRLAYFSISISAFVLMLFHIHALIKMDIYQIRPTVSVCSYGTSGIYFQFVTLSAVLFNVVIWVVLVILSVLSFKNVRQILAVPRKQQRRQFRSMTRKDLQLLRCLYAHDVVYIILGIYPAILLIYLAVRPTPTSGSLQVTIETFLSQLSNFAYHIPHCASVFIFISISKAFRQELKRMTYGMCGKNLMSVQEEVNRQQNNPRQIVELNVVNTIELSA